MEHHQHWLHLGKTNFVPELDVNHISLLQEPCLSDPRCNNSLLQQQQREEQEKEESAKMIALQPCSACEREFLN